MASSGNGVLAYFASDNNLFDFWLECVRQGRADMIQNYSSEEEKKAVCNQLFMGDRAYALRVCMTIWVEAVKIAEKVAVPNLVIDKTFEDCITRSQAASTPWMLVKLSEEYLVDFARIIDKSMYNGTPSPIFIKFQKYIKSHIYESLTIESIADALRISKSHLSHTIKRETGETVHAWILKEKINLARLMLSRNKYCMNEVWSFLGFCSQSHFAKCFRQMTGLTPTQYRMNLDPRDEDPAGDTGPMHNPPSLPHKHRNNQA